MAAGNFGPTEARQMQILEIEMMQDLFMRMTESCQRKCIPTRYGDAELTKGESVCVDRCVAKFLATQEMVTRKLAGLTKPAEAAAGAAAVGAGGPQLQ